VVLLENVLPYNGEPRLVASRNYAACEVVMARQKTITLAPGDFRRRSYEHKHYTR